MIVPFLHSVIEFFSQASRQHFIRLYAKKDNWHNLDMKTGNLGFGYIHYSVIRSQKLTKILCIGSRYGYIPASCAQACRDNKLGQVEFVDANYTLEDKNNWGGLGFWGQDRTGYFSTFGLDKYIQVNVSTSAEFRRKNSRKKWDYIYLDADHSYQGVKNDFELFWPALSKGGYLAMHDIFAQDEGISKYGTRKFWQEIKSSGKYHTIDFAGDYGLGLIKKG